MNIGPIAKDCNSAEDKVRQLQALPHH